MMWMRAARWVIAALIGSAMTTIGCGRPMTADEPRTPRQSISPDQDVAHAFDTRVEVRLIDRLELDSFLRYRDIQVDVVDGVVYVTGEVRTALEKRRVSAVLRHVAGVIDVVNQLEVRPPD
jgi:osmotically-inducible protein OsmY